MHLRLRNNENTAIQLLLLLLLHATTRGTAVAEPVTIGDSSFLILTRTPRKEGLTNVQSMDIIQWGLMLKIDVRRGRLWPSEQSRARLRHGGAG